MVEIHDGLETSANTNEKKYTLGCFANKSSSKIDQSASL